MELTIQVNPHERTVRFREVSSLAAGDVCSVTLDGVRGADLPSLRLALYRDAASASPVASCVSFSAVPGHPNLASGTLGLDTSEMAAWFDDVRPDDESSDDGGPSARTADAAERAARADGWLVVADRLRTWAACRVPAILRPGAGMSGVPSVDSLALLVEGLVAAAMADALAVKADKAVPAAAGSLASLDASGNLSDSGATPASIRAAAVAEVVANAPGTMDTLKEIADILGSAQQSGTVLRRISDLESGKVDQVQGKGLSANDYTDADKAKLDGLSPQAQADWEQSDSDEPDFVRNKPTIPVVPTLAAVATSGSYDDLLDKPTIPEPATVDPSLSRTSENPVQNKAVTAALYGGFTEWEYHDLPEECVITSIIYDDGEWVVTSSGWGVSVEEAGEDALVLNLFCMRETEPFDTASATATRRAFPPTKTSQLMNDGAPNGGGTPYATTAQIPDVTVKADKVSGATAGNLAALTAQGNLADSGVKASDFAAKADLPYALVTPGEWEFSGSGVESGVTYTIGEYEVDGTWYYDLNGNGEPYLVTITSSQRLLTVDFWNDGDGYHITATRASLPGHLLDRSVNLVNPTVTATTEWTWADGETGTPVFSNGYWTVQNASFAYDGPVAGSATDTEITFAKTDTKSFYFSSTDYDYDTGEQVFVFNVGGEGGEEVRAKCKWSDSYGENIVESIEYGGVEYALEYPATESSTGNTDSGTGTVAEHVVSLVATYGPTVTLTMPQAVPGRVRDLIVRIDLSQAAGAPPVAFAGGAFETADGEMPELVKGVNLLSFTETDAGVFGVAFKEMKPITAGGS